MIVPGIVSVSPSSSALSLLPDSEADPRVELESVIFEIDRFENAQNVMWWHFQLVCVLIFLLSLWCARPGELVH